jgi:adenylate kinase family enzyme
VIAHRISDELTRVSKDHSENEDTSRFGFLLKGFPYNTTQALLLDRYLNGVNLALHVRTVNESQDYLDSIKPLLNYYDERVSSYRLRVPSSS